MRFFLDRHGCAKNHVDAEILHGILLSLGWTAADEPEEAELILINSCGFIEDAKKESLEAVVSARAAYPHAKILLTGCLAERYAEVLRDDLPEADAFFGNGDLSRLPEILARLFPAADSAARTDSDSDADSGANPCAASCGSSVSSDAEFDAERGFPADVREEGGSAVSARPVLLPPQTGVCSGARPELFSFPGSAYVKLTEGCGNWCSFCAIPIIRGALRSRPADEIAGECAALVSRGIFELNFIGQDLAAYGTENMETPPWDTGFSAPSPLSLLLKKISALPGDFRVRLLYLHPDHFPRDILPVMAADARFLPYFDLPFQSGDADVLRGMNRRGDAARYLALLRDIRGAFSAPGNPYGTAVFRSTLLTGFPGETDAAFANTLSFLEEARFLWAGAFAFSPEEGTAACGMKPRVPKKVAAARRKAVYAAQEKITAEGLAAFVGRTLPVLVEELIPPESGEQDLLFAIGRAWFQAQDVDGSVVLRYGRETRDRRGAPLAPGSVVDARIAAVRGADVEAFAVGT